MHVTGGNNETQARESATPDHGGECSEAHPDAADPKRRATPQLQDQVLTVREAAERLRVCTATIYRLCATGRLPHIRVSNAIRILAADLRGFHVGAIRQSSRSPRTAVIVNPTRTG